MVSKFILPYKQLNLASLTSEKREKIIQQTRFTTTKAIKIFEYGKNNDRYWDGAKLYKQIVEKALPIVKAFYLGY